MHVADGSCVPLPLNRHIARFVDEFGGLSPERRGHEQAIVNPALRSVRCAHFAQHARAAQNAYLFAVTQGSYLAADLRRRAPKRCAPVCDIGLRIMRGSPPQPPDAANSGDQDHNEQPTATAHRLFTVKIASPSLNQVTLSVLSQRCNTQRSEERRV